MEAIQQAAEAYLVGFFEGVWRVHPCSICARSVDPNSCLLTPKPLTSVVVSFSVLCSVPYCPADLDPVVRLSRTGQSHLLSLRFPTLCFAREARYFDAGGHAAGWTHSW